MGALATTGVESVTPIDINDKRQIGTFALVTLLGWVSKVFDSLRHNAQEQASPLKECRMSFWGKTRMVQFKTSGKVKKV